MARTRLEERACGHRISGAQRNGSDAVRQKPKAPPLLSETPSFAPGESRTVGRRVAFCPGMLSRGQFTLSSRVDGSKTCDWASGVVVGPLSVRPAVAVSTGLPGSAAPTDAVCAVVSTPPAATSVPAEVVAAAASEPPVGAVHAAEKVRWQRADEGDGEPPSHASVRSIFSCPLTVRISRRSVPG